MTLLPGPPGASQRHPRELRSVKLRPGGTGPGPTKGSLSIFVRFWGPPLVPPLGHFSAMSVFFERSFLGTNFNPILNDFRIDFGVDLGRIQSCLMYFNQKCTDLIFHSFHCASLDSGF